MCIFYYCNCHFVLLREILNCIDPIRSETLAFVMIHEKGGSDTESSHRKINVFCRHAQMIGRNLRNYFCMNFIIIRPLDRYLSDYTCCIFKNGCHRKQIWEGKKKEGYLVLHCIKFYIHHCFVENKNRPFFFFLLWSFKKNNNDDK
jgi:hypothetical protein